MPPRTCAQNNSFMLLTIPSYREISNRHGKIIRPGIMMIFRFKGSDAKRELGHMFVYVLSQRHSGIILMKFVTNI